LFPPDWCAPDWTGGGHLRQLPGHHEHSGRREAHGPVAHGDVRGPAQCGDRRGMGEGVDGAVPVAGAGVAAYELERCPRGAGTRSAGRDAWRPCGVHAPRSGADQPPGPTPDSRRGHGRHRRTVPAQRPDLRGDVQRRRYLYWRRAAGDRARAASHDAPFPAPGPAGRPARHGAPVARRYPGQQALSEDSRITQIIDRHEFETTEFGRLNYSGDFMGNQRITYRETRPGRLFRSYSTTVMLNNFSYYDTDLGYRSTLSSNNTVTFHNFWVGTFNLQRHFRGTDVQLTRGGPTMGTPFGWQWTTS